jgi:hypothetical protein
MHRETGQAGETYALAAQSKTYEGKYASENEALRVKNPALWEKNDEAVEA